MAEIVINVLHTSVANDGTHRIFYHARRSTGESVDKEMTAFFGTGATAEDINTAITSDAIGAFGDNEGDRLVLYGGAVAIRD